MSDLAKLCEFCAQIPFDPEILQKNARDSLIKYQLGSGTQVKSSQCPFCKLVVRAYVMANKDVSKYSQVSMIWSQGPGKRRAFNIINHNDIWIGFGSASDRCPRDDPEDPDTRKIYYIEPTTADVLNATRILRWISRCEQRHGLECMIQTPRAFSDAFRGLPFLRLIDLQASCLVEKGEFVRYAALSYVWGAVPNFRLTKANRTALLADSALDKVYRLLPNTIQDAMAFVGRLGCQYLWVDALCVLQNDTVELDQGVDAMDLIYERAWVTVVAGFGHDANAHLPGVKAGTRMASRNTVEIKPGIDMGIVAGLGGLLKNSVYDSRAWTFQELVLSRRAIHFIGNKVFYRCRVSEHLEDFADISSTFSQFTAPNGSLLPIAVEMKDPTWDYAIFLFYYSKRALTNQNDALRAMAGIIRRFTEAMKCRFLGGLPTASFDRFIIFYAFGNSLHRRANFPSYSWAGWRGAINVVDCPGRDSDDSDGNGWLRNRTWIIWYKRNPSGITSLVWDPIANESFPSWDMEYLGYRDRRPFFDGRPAFEQLNIKRTAPTEDVSFSRTVPTYPILQFWTLSVFYKIKNIDVFAATSYLVDRNKNKCGFVWLDGFEETTFFESDGPFNFILLSESDKNPHSMDLDDEFESNGRYPRKVDQWRYYHILLLEWEGGIAERRGFGVIFQDAVAASLSPGPLWSEIFLA